MRTGLNQLNMRSVPFSSSSSFFNAMAKYGEDLEKKIN